jgi:hypothetical protein
MIEKHESDAELERLACAAVDLICRDGCDVA